MEFKRHFISSIGELAKQGAQDALGGLDIMARISHSTYEDDTFSFGVSFRRDVRSKSIVFEAEVSRIKDGVCIGGISNKTDPTIYNAVCSNLRDKGYNLRTGDERIDVLL